MNTDSIPSLAAHMFNGKRANKKECIAVVDALVKMGTEGRLAPRQVATLYSYFTPARPAKPKCAADYVQRAVPKDDMRDYLNAMYSNGDRLMGTDGHRVHLSSSVVLPEGHYDARVNRVEKDGKFPDVDRVIPKYGSCDLANDHNYLDNLEVVKSGGIEAAVLNSPTGVRVQVSLKYLRDATQNVDNLRLYVRGAMDSVVIEGTVAGDNVLAVVMPMRQ